MMRRKRRKQMARYDATVSRRNLLIGASTIGTMGALGSLSPAFAKAPKLGTQAPPFYRSKVGDFEVTIVTDGPLPLGDPHKNFTGLSEAEMDKQLTDNFLPLSNAVLEQNALVVNTGDKLIVFDTGMGSLTLFGP